MSALGSKMRSVRRLVQPPSDARPGPSGQPRPPNPWTGWTPTPVLQGLGDRHDILQGLGDRHDIGPVRGGRTIRRAQKALRIKPYRRAETDGLGKPGRRALPHTADVPKVANFPYGGLVSDVANLGPGHLGADGGRP